MITEISKPSQRLLTAVLILLSAPVLHILWNLFFIEGKFTVSKISPYSFSVFLELGISITLIILLAMRKFGVVLFFLAWAIMKFIRMLFSLEHFNDFSPTFWCFQFINAGSIVVMIMLLKRENGLFFNLDFKSKPIGFMKTFRLMTAFNLVFLVTQAIALIVVASQMELHLMTFFNDSFLLFLVALALTIIAMMQKTKLINAAFFLVLASVLNTFISNGYFLLAPFTGNWNNGWAMIGVIYGIVLDVLLITYGTVFYFIIRAYSKEKTLTLYQSPPELL